MARGDGDIIEIFQGLAEQDESAALALSAPLRRSGYKLRGQGATDGPFPPEPSQPVAAAIAYIDPERSTVRHKMLLPRQGDMPTDAAMQLTVRYENIVGTARMVAEKLHDPVFSLARFAVEAAAGSQEPIPVVGVFYLFHGDSQAWHAGMMVTQWAFDTVPRMARRSMEEYLAKLSMSSSERAAAMEAAAWILDNSPNNDTGLAFIAASLHLPSVDDMRQMLRM